MAGTIVRLVAQQLVTRRQLGGRFILVTTPAPVAILAMRSVTSEAQYERVETLGHTLGNLCPNLHIGDLDGDLGIFCGDGYLRYTRLHPHDRIRQVA